MSLGVVTTVVVMLVMIFFWCGDGQIKEEPNEFLHLRDFARLPLLRLLDQRWWAARVKDLGCGSKPVKAAIFATIYRVLRDSPGPPAFLWVLGSCDWTWAHVPTSSNELRMRAFSWHIDGALCNAPKP